MNYKQSVYSLQLKYTNNEYRYNIDSFSGERIEEEKRTSMNVCKSLFQEDFHIDNKFFSGLRKILEQTEKECVRKNIKLSAYLDLHNEIVLIDDLKKNDKSYGFFRLCFKSDNVIHLEDIYISLQETEKIVEIVQDHVEGMEIKKLPSKNQVTDFFNVPHVLSSQAAGYFIHEIIGHMLEADYYCYVKEKFSNIKIPSNLTVVDSVYGKNAILERPVYDDVGIEKKDLILVKEGKVQNILAIHKEDSFNNELYGVARRESYKDIALPRMRNTFIRGYDKIGEKEIISKYSYGVWVSEILNGCVDFNTGNYFLRGNGNIIRNGNIQNFIGNLQINGNLFSDLSLIEYIGNDMKFYYSFCQKLNQKIRVSCGGPTISLKALNSKGTTYGRR